MLLSRLISAAFDDETFTLYGRGDARRDFTSVSDVVEAMVLAAESRSPQRVFNISGGQVMSVADVIQMVEEVFEKRIRVETAGTESGDVKCTYADLTRARTELGYAPSWRLEDTIRAQVEFASQYVVAARSVAAGAH
jgi:nucleoside-diphosphate-sugar epimerase